MDKEKVFYPILISLLVIGIAGLPVIRYGIYLAPIIGFVVMLASSDVSIKFTKPVYPFVFLLVTITFSIYQADYHWAKQAYFVLAYTSIFLFYDFSKISPDMRKLNILIAIVFLLQEILTGGVSSFLAQRISLIDSKSALESTLAFPFGLFAVYFLYKKQYGWFVFNLVVAGLAFKRVVLLGIIICFLVYLVPKRIRALILNPFLLTIAIVIGVVIQVELASGLYDQFIHNYFGISTDHLLMGRQQLWDRAIRYADFNYLDFLFWGLGHGVLTGYLEGSYGEKNVLLHSDFLLLTLEHGFLFLVVFSFLLSNQRTQLQKALSLYLIVLFASDNVLIYQHVMIPYLLLMGLEKVKSKNKVFTQKSGVILKPAKRILKIKGSLNAD